MKKMIRLTACAVALFSLLTAQKAQPQLADSPWPMFMHDAQHTGRSQYAGPERIGVVAKYEISYGSSQAIGNDGTVYLGAIGSAIGNDSTIYVHGTSLQAINRDGIRLWECSPSRVADLSAVTMEGRVKWTGGPGNWSYS